MKIKKEKLGFVGAGLAIILTWTRFFVPDKYFGLLWILMIGLLLAAIIGYIYFYKTQREAINIAFKPKYLFSLLVFFICMVGLSTILLVMVLMQMESIPYPRLICTLIVVFSYIIIYLVFIQFKALSDHEIKIEGLLAKKGKEDEKEIIDKG